MQNRLMAGMAALTIAASACAGQDLEDFWAREMAGIRRALTDPSANRRVRAIWFKLGRDTGRLLPVLPAQQFNLGQALPNGVVLLDLGVAGDESEEVTAFWLAHEYGHQVLGHTQLALTPVGRWMAAMGGTRQEDDADRWAARFLKRQSYDLQPVIRFLCALPGGDGNDAHSSGPVRASNVARSYGIAGGSPCEGGGDAPERPQKETFAVRMRMWPPNEGNPAEFDVDVDGEEKGHLSNLRSSRTLDLDELEEGPHRFKLRDITVYGPGGVVLASELECSEKFTVRSARTFNLWARLTPEGDVFCGVR